MRQLLFILPIVLMGLAFAQGDAIAVRIAQLASDEREVRTLAEEQLLLIGEPAIKPLAEALGDPKLANPARRLLVRIGAPAVNPLIAVLLGKNTPARMGAAETLGEIGDVRALDPVIATTRDADLGVRIASVYALAHLPDPRGDPALIQALGSGDAAVAPIAALALARREQADAARPMVLALNTNPRVADALVVLGEPGAQALLTAMKVAPPGAGEVRAMGLFRDLRFAALLREALASTTPAVRLEAARGLGLLRDPAAVDALAKALGDTNPGVRIAAAEALGGIGDPRGVAPLAKAMASLDVTVQGVALTALGRIGDATAIEALLAVLKSGKPAVRAGAAQWLGIIGDPKAEDALALSMRDPEGVVADAALKALSHIGDPRATSALIAAIKAPSTTPLSDMDAAIGQATTDAAVKRRGLAALLSHYPHTEALSLWSALAQKDTDPAMRAIAVRALAIYTDPRALDALALAVKDTDEDVAALAARVLAKTRTPWAARVLVAAYKGQWWDGKVIGLGMQAKPILTWQRIGAPAVDPLVNVANGADQRARAWAVAALAEIGDARAAKAFQAAAAGADPLLQSVGLRGLAAVKDPTAFDLLVAALKHADPAVRMAAVWGLGRLGDARAVDLLIPILGDAALQRTAVIALTALKDPKAVAALAALLPTTQFVAQHDVCKALGAMGDAGAEAVAAYAEGMTGTRRHDVLPVACYTGLPCTPGMLALCEEAVTYGKESPRSMVSTFVQDATGPRVDALRRRLARESDTTAAAAIPGAEGAALLRRMLGDPDPRVRADAAFALARRDRRAAVTALIALLADPDEATRRHANRALTEAAGADQGTTMYRWRAWAKGQGL